MNKIQGHGIPTKFKAAERGTVYTDLDTGKRYKCLGPKGFVNQDAVDEPLEYHWQLVNMVEDNQIPNGGVELPFGEKTVMGDTLTWDGNTEGLEVGVMVFPDGDSLNLYRISDATPTREDFANGFSVTILDGGTDEYENDEYLYDIAENVIDVDSCILIAYEDNISVTFSEGDGVIECNLPKKGIYMTSDVGGFSLTINGCNGFPRTEIVPLDPKYIKDMYYATEGKTLFEGEVTFDGNSIWQCPFSLERNVTYKFIIDGEEYIQALTYDGLDFAAYINHSDGNDLSFYEGNNSYCTVNMYPITYTIAVSVYDEDIVPLNAKYLPASAVRSDMAQTFSEEEQLQARQNIGAINASDISSNLVYTADASYNNISTYVAATLNQPAGFVLQDGVRLRIKSMPDIVTYGPRSELRLIVRGESAIIYDVGGNKVTVSSGGSGLPWKTGNVAEFLYHKDKWYCIPGVFGVATNTTLGFVELTNTLVSYDQDGVAATPKLVNEALNAAKKYTDEHPVILTSPNGTRFNVTVGDDGVLTATEITE